MSRYRHVLVIIDPTLEKQLALRRAIYLQPFLNCTITALLVVWDREAEATREDRVSYMAGRRRWLEQVVEAEGAAGFPVQSKVVWHRPAYEAILEEAALGKYDLLIKMARQAEGLDAILYTPLDWQLLRKSPCPVWMVKDQPWPEPGKALVAVNLAGEDRIHDQLNEKLVRSCLEMAQTVRQTEVHLVAVYPVDSMNLTAEMPDFDDGQYNESIRGHYLVAMKALRQKFSLDEKLTHVMPGLPEEVIPRLANELGAAIVVFGTVGRTGLSAAFIGNTTEQVIDQLNCDLLVLKPDSQQRESQHSAPTDAHKPGETGAG